MRTSASTENELSVQAKLRSRLSGIAVAGAKNVQCGAENCQIAFQAIVQPLGHREHPLAHRQARDDMVGQMRGGLRHTAGGAGWVDAATLARVGDQEVVPALGVTGACKAVGEDAAVEVAAEFPLDYRGRSCSGAIILKRRPSCKIRLYRAI